jgi:preprotein translocase subunit YajC
MKRLSLLIAAIFLFSASAVSAAEQNKTWEELEPKLNGFDWVQTTSGEWLKGEIKSIYRETLTFDSDNLGIVTIDFDDIAKLLSREPMEVSLEDGRTLHGMATIENGKLVISGKEGKNTVKADEIVSMLSGSSGELDRWGIKVTLGFDIRDGNTKQYDVTSQANLVRQTTASRYNLDYIGTLTVVDYNTTTSQSTRVNSNLDLFQTKRFYWRPMFVEYFSDTYQNIRHRATYGAGAGYDVIDTSKITWSLTGGPAGQFVEYVDVEQGEEKRIVSPALMVQSRFDQEINDKVDFIWNYNFYVLNEKSGSYTHHMIATLETEFVDDFTMDLSAIWDRVEKPAKREDGTTPFKDDTRLVFSIGYSY